MIQELETQKNMLLKESKMINDSVMYVSEITTKTGLTYKQIMKQRLKAINLPLINIYRKVKEIDRQISELYNVKAIGIEKDFFYKIPNKLI